MPRKAAVHRLHSYRSYSFVGIQRLQLAWTRVAASTLISENVIGSLSNDQYPGDSRFVRRIAVGNKLVSSFG